MIAKGAQTWASPIFIYLDPRILHKGSIDETIWHMVDQFLDEYDRKLADLKCQFADFQGRNFELTDYEVYPPLSLRVLDEPIPSPFKMPQLDPYDSTMDLLGHLKSYKALIQV